MYPSRYEKLYYYAKKANCDNSTQYYVQDILKQIRKNPYFELKIDDIQNVVKDDKIIAFIENYKSAVNATLRDNFDQAKNILRQLDCFGYLKCEANLLLSQCLIKSLNIGDRDEAVYLLNDDAAKEDKNLLFRYSVRRISAYVHNGKYSNGITEFNNLLDTLLKDYENTHSNEILDYINIINRRSNNVLCCDLALKHINCAVESYELQNDNPIGKYIALSNLFGINILNYNLYKAKEIKNKLNFMEAEFPRIKFPRRYIYENNLILFQYFNHDINSIEAEKNFLDLINSNYKNDFNGDRADLLFYRSNYSIFLALNGKLQDAIELLENEQCKLNEDKEGIYDLRLTVNLAIFKFIKNNENRENSLKELEKISFNNQMPDVAWQIKKIKKIKEVIRDEAIINIDEWVKKVEYTDEKLSSDPFLYYGKAFVYTTVFNWDDD